MTETKIEMHKDGGGFTKIITFDTVEELTAYLADFLAPPEPKQKTEGEA